MKLRFLCLLLVCLMVTSTFGATIGAWIQSPVNGTISGNFTDPCMWKSSSNGQPPVPTTNTGDEIKFNTPMAVSTVNTTLAPYNCKFTVAAGTHYSKDYSTTNVHIVKVQSGALMKVGAFQVGHGSSTDKGQWGLVQQTNGTVKAEKLVLGTYGTRGIAHGQYVISGGTLTSNSDMASNSGRLIVGGVSSGGGTSANNEGIFTVVGDGSTISMKELYVGSYSTFYGKGTLEFIQNVDDTGITPITVSSVINLDNGGASSIANLTVIKRNAIKGPIVLVVNAGTNAVSGLFDSLNGGSAAQGASVTLLDGNAYTLTYQYNNATGAHTGGNDIALIPEPATIALLTLGLIAIRRKK